MPGFLKIQPSLNDQDAVFTGNHEFSSQWQVLNYHIPVIFFPFRENEEMTHRSVSCGSAFVNINAADPEVLVQKYDLFANDGNYLPDLSVAPIETVEA